MKVNDNELRIGNYVNEPKGQLHRVERTAEDTHRTRYVVPLTEEWLLKLGFKDQKNAGGWFEIEIDEFRELDISIKQQKAQLSQAVDDRHTTYDFYDMVDKTKYVHQLQNLYFALTGEELTITS